MDDIKVLYPKMNFINQSLRQHGSTLTLTKSFTERGGFKFSLKDGDCVCMLN